MNLLWYFAVVLCVLYYYYVKYKSKRRRFENMIDMFHGPRGIPILGNALEFLKSPADALKTYKKMCATHNSPFRLWMVNKPFITLLTPEDFEIVAHKNLEKDSTVYGFAADVTGDGLLTSEVTKWKRHRRIITPALNPLVYFNHFLQIFNRQDGNLMKQLSKEVGTGKHFDLWPYVIENAVVKICETGLGYEDKEGATEALHYGHALMKSSELVSKRLYQFWLIPWFTFTVYRYLLGYGNIFKMVQRLPMKVLKKRKEERNKSKSKNHPGIADGKELLNVIDVLLNKDCFTDEDLCAEINTLMFGGSETGAVVLCFTMLMLGIEQHIQEKVYREIFNVFGDDDRLPEQSDLNRLPYLEQCIKETMRRFSVVPLGIRSIHEDTPISDGKILPAGASVALATCAVHGNPNIYPNPETWDPSNFDPDKVASRHKCSFVAFSAGPRGCIGQKYAFLSLKAQISTLLRNFKVTTDVKSDEIELTVDILIRSIHGYNIKLDYRHGKSLF